MTPTTEWVSDQNGNKCSVAYWGSIEKAQAALSSLKNCKNCRNCSRCSGCSRCSRCSDCSDCSRCSGCSDCSDCSRCSGCLAAPLLRCSGCSDLAPGESKAPVIPVIPDFHKTVYTAASRPESLEMATWHTCENTHCRGGWIVALAGSEGKELERFYNSELAAMLIYHKSTGERINPCRFYDSNEDALADIKRLAGV